MTNEKRKNKDNKKSQQSFWTTLPGILTGIAALLTAIGGLVAALSAAGVFAPQVTPAPATPTLTASLTSTQIPTVPPTVTPTPETPPTFVSEFVFDMTWDIQQVEFESEPGILPTETITDFLQLSRVAFGKLESSDLAYSVQLRIKNTESRPFVLDLDERFFSLEDDHGRAAELVYFCCPSQGEILASGQERVVELIFLALPEWVGKEVSVSAVFFRVRGLLPVVRAAWLIPSLAVAE